MAKIPNTPILPQTGYLRLAQVLQFIPFKKTRWYKGVKSGEFPQPIKMGAASLYRAEEIHALIERIGMGEVGHE